MTKILHDILKRNYNNIEIVDDLEYYDELKNGIIVYFKDGTCFQIINNDNNFIVVNDTLSILIESNSIDDVMKCLLGNIKKKELEILQTR